MLHFRQKIVLARLLNKSKWIAIGLLFTATSLSAIGVNILSQVLRQMSFHKKAFDFILLMSQRNHCIVPPFNMYFKKLGHDHQKNWRISNKLINEINYYVTEQKEYNQWKNCDMNYRENPEMVDYCIGLSDYETYIEQKIVEMSTKLGLEVSNELIERIHLELQQLKTIMIPAYI